MCWLEGSSLLFVEPSLKGALREAPSGVNKCPFDPRDSCVSPSHRFPNTPHPGTQGSVESDSAQLLGQKHRDF